MWVNRMSWRTGMLGLVTGVTDQLSSAPQSTVCQLGKLLLTGRRRPGSFPQMSPSQTKATVRMVAASFAAGVSAMLLLGLVAPVAVQGGLSVRDAIAMPEPQAHLIEPLDVA